MHGREIKQDDLGAATLKPSQHVATHLHHSSTTLKPPSGTNHSQDVHLLRSQAPHRSQYSTTLHRASSDKTSAI